MIFIDNFEDEIIFIHYLHNILLMHIKNDRKRIIRTFTLVLESDVKEKYLKDFIIVIEGYRSAQTLLKWGLR